MDPKTFKQCARNRQLVWGTCIGEFMTSQTMRFLHIAGFDWFWLENEHAHHNYESIHEVIRTAYDLNATTVLRVTDLDYALIARAYDMGVGGVIVPRVETPEQMRRIVEYAKYPPVGRRGFGMRPTHWMVLNKSMTEIIEDQQHGRSLFIMLESKRGVDNCDAIIEAAGGELDGVFFGPADYQMDLGIVDAFASEAVLEAGRRLHTACQRHGISLGVPAGGLDGIRQWRDIGFNLLSYGSDATFMAQSAAQAREELTQIER